MYKLMQQLCSFVINLALGKDGLSADGGIRALNSTDAQTRPGAGR